MSNEKPKLLRKFIEIDDNIKRSKIFPLLSNILHIKIFYVQLLEFTLMILMQNVFNGYLYAIIICFIIDFIFYYIQTYLLCCYVESIFTTSNCNVFVKSF